jgi:glycosyltransferase involved in cell wall biosynthesis
VDENRPHVVDSCSAAELGEAHATRPLLCVSATEAETQRLLEAGPRRDFVELAKAIDGDILYAPGKLIRRKFLGRLFGGHVRQAWNASKRIQNGGRVFADGEHIGIPLAIFLSLRMKRRTRIVMLGHLLTRPWKLLLLAIVTTFGPAGVIIVHSGEQARRIRPWVRRGWQVSLLPYQVDVDYWTRSQETTQSRPPTILAVGSENRDYDVLVAAAAGLAANIVIAAGSHWARTTAGSGARPNNVTYLTEPLPFHELRTLYERATAVVVPLRDVPNQSGVTTILEGMAMSIPIVVTANRGQRECVRGPLVRADGTVDELATAERGPGCFTRSQPAEWNGLYVEPGDPESLRKALEIVANDANFRRRMGGAGRAAATGTFRIEGFVAAVAEAITR